MCMYNRFSLLYSRNKHHTINQLYRNKNFKQVKRGYFFISSPCVCLILNSEYLKVFMSLTA